MLLYIHIPFCDSKCSYCSFNSYVDKFHLRQQYMQALEKQLIYELEHFHVQPQSIETIFIGGGTPSTVAPELYAPLFQRLQPYLQPHAEITSEANPNSATPVWLQGMYDLGVNRISFGVQSFNPEKLKTLARAHSSDQASQAIITASKIGYKNLSLDLIYATLGDTKALLQEDLNRAFSLPINHLSAYALTIEEGTPFAATPQMSSERLDFTKWLFQSIAEHGFHQYEISNFGTYESIHNQGYWQYKDYIGLGSGAVGFKKETRFYPTSSVEGYINNPLDIATEQLSESDIHSEKIFLGLRCNIGVDADILNQHEKERAAILVEEDKLKLCNNRYYNSDYLLSDELALFIMS